MEGMEKNIKKYITSLLTSTPLLMTMQQLSKDYRNTIGEPIQYQKLGYNSLEHFLRSINDTVIVQGSGPTAHVIPVYSEKSAHVNSLVQNQKVCTAKKRQYQSRRTTYNSPRMAKMNATQIQPSRKIVYPSIVSNFSNTSRSSSLSFSSGDYTTYPSEPHVAKKPIDALPATTSRNTTARASTSASFTANTSYKKTETCDNQKVDLNHIANRLRQDTIQKPLDKPSDKPQNVINKKCSSVKNLIKNIGPNKDKALSEAERKIPYYIRNNLRSLIGQFPNGLWCADVPENYRRLYHQDLNYQELGYGTLINLCTDLSSIFHYVRPSNGDFKLYDKSRPLPDCAERKFTIASYSVNQRGSLGTDSGALPQIDWDDVNTYLPEDIFKPGGEIPRVFVSQDLQVNETIDVIVGEVYDLSKFWVCIQDSQLDQLMDDLQNFYNAHAADYEIPNHLIKEGLYCVQVIYGEYHRALIVNSMPDVEDMIRVIFIDYGTMSKISSIGLCFLHSQFAELPAQAIRCRLANVMPLEEGSTWSKEASKAFREMVTDRDISAKIISINWEDQFLVVYLADVTDESNIFYVNDRLVEEGFATYPKKERSHPVIDPLYKPIVKLIHLFPTFVELEHGLAPSTAEMEVFHDLEVPINFCYPQYFHVDNSFELEIIAAAEEVYEANIGRAKRRVPLRNYVTEKLQQTPMDYSVFGELATEIKNFNEHCPVETVHDSDEDFADADEEFQGLDENGYDEMEIARKIRELNIKEEETVQVLKNDLRMTEDIMKDINEICNIGSLPSSSVNATEKLQSEVEDISVEYVANERELWTIDESRESFNTSNCTLVQEKSPEKPAEEEEFTHPLSKMSFDKDSPTNEVASPLFERDFCESLDSFGSDIDNIPTGEDFISQIMKMVQNSNSNEVPIDQQLSDVSTNPFLSDLSDNQDVSLKNLRLNSNNPFLSEPKSDSSSSTTYNSAVIEVKTQHSWSQFSDISAETISELGRSLSSKSSLSSQVAVEDRHNCSISTQTSDEKPVPAPSMDNYPNFQSFYPPPVAYAYAQWSMGYGNPYYRQAGYFEPQGARFRPPVPPGIPPPPGFTPLQYRGMPGFFPGSGFAPRPNFCGPPMGNFAARVTAPAPPVNVSDFYEAYNSQLLRHQDRNAK